MLPSSRVYCLLVFLICVGGGVSSSTPSKIGNGYRLVSIEETPDGAIVGHLQVKQKNDIYGPDIPHLQFFVKYETNHIFLQSNFHVFDLTDSLFD